MTLFLILIVCIQDDVQAQSRPVPRSRPISYTVVPGERIQRSAPLPRPRRRPPGSRRPYYPPAPGIGNAFSCGIGDAGGCLNITAETLESLDNCSQSTNIDGLTSSIGALLINRYADTLFFQELANRSVSATNCQVQILTPGQTAPLVSSAYQMFQTLTPLIQTLARARNKADEDQRNQISRAVESSQGGSGYGIAYSGSVQRVASNRDRINQAIDQILTQLPFGSHPEARANLQALAERGASEAEFAAAYSANLNTLRGKFVEAQNTFSGIQDRETGYYNLSHSQYVELYAAQGARQFASQIDPSGRSLKCRFDACFIDGPRNTQFAAILGLAGLTVLTLGEASPLLVAATSAAGVALSAAQIAASCGQQTLNATAQIQGQCTSQQIAQTTLTEMSRTQCAVDVALGSLDLIIPGAAALRRTARTAIAAREVRVLAAIDDAAETAVAGSFLRQGEHGSRVYRNAENIETTVFPNGRREYLYPNGTRITEENGVRTTRYPNGVRDVEENGVRSTYEGRTLVERRAADGTIDRPVTDIVVSGDVLRGASLRVAGRLERGENASGLIERLGYARVSDAADDVQVFRNARGQEITIPSGQRLSTADADRVKAILDRGEGSFTAPGVRRSADGAITVADDAGRGAGATRVGNDLPSPSIRPDVPPVAGVRTAETTPIRLSNADNFELGASRLPVDRVRDVRRMGLEDILRTSDQEAGFYGRIRGNPVTAEAERRATLDHIAERFAAWDRLNPNPREDILRFLDGVTDVEKRRQYSAIILNAANNNPIEALTRLRRFSGELMPALSKVDYEAFLQSRIRELDGASSSTAAQIATRANERSALELEYFLISRGDQVSVEGIFSARSHNEVMRAAGRDPHSFDDSFNVDIKVRDENGLPLCRGSTATEGLASGIVGGFFSPGCPPNLTDRRVNGRTAATPRDTTLEDNLQGYNRFNALPLEQNQRITIGRNGDVRYSDAEGTVYRNTGGEGGGLEAFPSRLGDAPKVENLLGSSRAVTCSQQYSEICNQLLAIRGRTTTRGLGPDAVQVLERELAEVRTILGNMDATARRAVNDIDNLGTVENLNGLNRTYPELLSTLNVERELELKLQLARSNPQGFARGRFPLDTESAAFRDSAIEASAFQRRVPSALPPSTTAADAQARLTRLLEEANATATVSSFRRNNDIVRNELSGLENTVNSPNSLAELRRINQAAGVAEDMYLGVRGITNELRSQVNALTNISAAEKARLLRLIDERMPGFPLARPNGGRLYAPAD